MISWEVEALKRALTAREALVLPAPERARARASVALILHVNEGRAAPSICFIQRAVRSTDSWSGHIALPGGRREPGDQDALATAIRETGEEIGLRLERRDCLGALDEVDLSHRGSTRGGVLTPYVFLLRGEVPPLELQPTEVASCFWASVNQLLDPASRCLERFAVPGHEGGLKLPGLRHGEHVIWGLTYGVLHDLFERLGHALPPLPY